MFCSTNTGLSKKELVEHNHLPDLVLQMLCSTMDKNNLTLTNLTTTDDRRKTTDNRQTDRWTDRHMNFEREREGGREREGEIYKLYYLLVDYSSLFQWVHTLNLESVFR